MKDDTYWHISAQAYLARLGAAEYAAQRKAHKRAASKFRFTPSEYMRELIGYLGTNAEESFKTRKMLEGYSSAIGV